MNSFKPMTDAEREAYIARCGRQLVEAMAAGNRQEAVSWMQAEMLAISQRSPAQQARMTAAIDQAIDDGVNYFDSCGARHSAEFRRAA